MFGLRYNHHTVVSGNVNPITSQDYNGRGCCPGLAQGSRGALFSADSLALGQRRQLGGRYEDGLQRQKQPPLTGLPHSRQLFLDSHNSPAVLFAFEKAV